MADVNLRKWVQNTLDGEKDLKRREELCGKIGKLIRIAKDQGKITPKGPQDFIKDTDLVSILATLIEKPLEP